MTKLTTELLEKFVSDIKTDGMCDITDHQVESALIQLLAYEQAADRPVGEIFRCSGNKTLRWWNDVPEGTVLYAAPVLPKQPEHSRQHFESLCNQFWNWAEFDEINQDEEPRLEWNGSDYTHRVTAALWKMYQAAPAQPVIPEQPKPTISFYLDGIIAAAQWVEKQREAYDNEHGQHDSDTGFFEFGNDAQRDYSETLAEIAEGIRSLHPATAQPVSEPYKLNGWISVDEKMPEDGDAAPARESE